MLHMTYSPAGLALTKRYEGDRLTAYLDSVGVPTIGRGHTGRGVYLGLTITEEQSDQLLQSDLAAAVACVNGAVTATITQHQFDALVDFTFNLGRAALLGSTLLKLVNAGNFKAAAGEFTKWDHAGGQELPGLKRRRLDEAALALSASADDIVQRHKRLAAEARLFRKVA